MLADDNIRYYLTVLEEKSVEHEFFFDDGNLDKAGPSDLPLQNKPRTCAPHP